VVGQQIWERFCEALQTPEWLADPRFATNRLRRENREALHREIDAILENGDSATWVDMLNAQGVPCGPVYSIDQVFDDPQMKALGMVQDLPTGRERRSYLGQPISMTRTPSRLVQHAPELGQHTDEILRAFGYVPSELERLRKEAII
jgi:crotonobetainyl-CoA:carnitine CoA-transferase CaiB-like acyl-CoA transferase